jgi:hypothetical protein
MIREVKLGVDEIDLLALHPAADGIVDTGR